MTSCRNRETHAPHEHTEPGSLIASRCPGVSHGALSDHVRVLPAPGHLVALSVRNAEVLLTPDEAAEVARSLYGLGTDAMVGALHERLAQVGVPASP